MTAGTTTVNTTSGGVPRLYLQRIPVGYDGTTPIPVVFDIHGFIETAAIQQVMSEMGPIADANKFIVIYPQALGNPTVWDTRIGGPDLAYIGHVLDEVEGRLCAGSASGVRTGSVHGRCSCPRRSRAQYADRFAAVAPVAGIRDPAGCAPSRPVPVVTFHGTADTWVDFAPIPGIVTAWAARNHSAPRPKETTDRVGRHVGPVPVSHR